MTEVVVAIIARPRRDETEYLLVSSRRDFGELSGHFYPPGGHVEAGETREQALTREVAEEVGLIVEPIRELARTPGDVSDQVTSWWQCGVVGGEFAINGEELAEAGYYSPAEMAVLPLWPATRKFFRDFMLTPSP